MLRFNFLLQALLELLLLVFYPIINIVRFFIPLKKVTKHSRYKTPIIIVEQWFTQNPLHLLMKTSLEKKGFKVYLFNYSILRGGIEDGAQSLAQFIDKNNITSCILVGISTGAVTSYTYAEHYNGWEKVKKLISLAGPLKGTPLAYFIYFLKTGSQLVPSSDFMNNLKPEHSKYPSRIVCVHPKYDELVPKWSNTISEARHVEVNIAGHNNFHIWSQAIFKFLIRESLKVHYLQ